MPKTKHPVADYITFEQFQKMVDGETDDMYKLLYRYMWTFLLRVSEAVGQSEADVKQLHEQRKERERKVKAILADPVLLEKFKRAHKDKDPSIGKHKWNGALPGIRVMDIDAVSPESEGLDSAHTLRIFRKMGKFEIMPFNDTRLFVDTMAYIKRPKLKDTDRLFAILRQEVLQHMNRHGKTVGGMTKIHPHALRRGGGVYLRMVKKVELEDLQNIYSHSNMSQTLAYIGRDKKTSFNRFSKVQGGSKE